MTAYDDMHDDSTEIAPELLALDDLDTAELHPDELFIQQAVEAAKIAEEEALRVMLKDLPDQGVATSSQHEKYALQKKHRAKMKKACDIAAKEAAQRYVQANPDATELGCIPNSVIKLDQPRNMVDLKRFIEQVITCILLQGDKYKTMSAVLAFVNKEFPHAPQSQNIWTVQLPAFQLKRIMHIARYTRPTWNVRLSGCKSLRDCREAILLAKEKLSGHITIKTEVSISKSKLRIGDKIFPISTARNGDYEYQRVRVQVGEKRQWVRLDTFLALFGITE